VFAAKPRWATCELFNRIDPFQPVADAREGISDNRDYVADDDVCESRFHFMAAQIQNEVVNSCELSSVGRI